MHGREEVTRSNSVNLYAIVVNDSGPSQCQGRNSKPSPCTTIWAGETTVQGLMRPIKCFRPCDFSLSHPAAARSFSRKPLGNCLVANIPDCRRVSRRLWVSVFLPPTRALVGQLDWALATRWACWACSCQLWRNPKMSCTVTRPSSSASSSTFTNACRE